MPRLRCWTKSERCSGFSHSGTPKLWTARSHTTTSSVWPVPRQRAATRGRILPHCLEVGAGIKNETGSASLEFITVGMLMLLPLVYLVLAVSAIQAGSLAVEGAARQAARVFVQGSTVGEAAAQAERAVEFALADYRIDSTDAVMRVTCAPDPTVCLTRLGIVTVEVGVRVQLPLVPPVLTLDVPLAVPLEATATQQVSRFWSGR